MLLEEAWLFKNAFAQHGVKTSVYLQEFFKILLLLLFFNTRNIL